MITMVRNGWPYRSFNVLLHMLLILHLFWTYIILKAAYFKIVHGEVGITTFALYTRLYGGYSAAIFRYTFGPPTFIGLKFGNPNFFWTTNFYRAKVWCPKTTFNCLIQCSMFSRIKCAYFYNKLFGLYLSLLILCIVLTLCSFNYCLSKIRNNNSTLNTARYNIYT